LQEDDGEVRNGPINYVAWKRRIIPKNNITFLNDKEKEAVGILL
jgi:hypothetical protein